MCAAGSGVPNLQTELNYLNLFKAYCNFSDLGFLSSGGWAGGWGVSGGMGDVPTHMHIHMHACTCIHV